MSRRGSKQVAELGTGLIYIPGSEPVIEACDRWIDVIEIEPQTFWSKTQSDSSPYRNNLDRLAWVRSLDKAKLLHGVGNPLGGTLSLDFDQFPAFREFADAFQPSWVSEHLSFNRASDGGQVFSTGFFLPPLQTHEVAAVCAENIRKFQDSVRLPAAFETGVKYISKQKAEMPDGAFFRAVAEQADCAILLDLHNLWTNQCNGGYQVLEVLSQLPLERVWEIHLAGGEEIGGCWIDAHSGLVPAGLMRITENVVRRLPNLKAVIFEIMPQHIHAKNLDLGQIADHLHWMHDVWETRGTVISGGDCQDLPIVPDATSSQDSICLSGRSWENAVGRLVVGKEADSNLEQALQADPGIDVFRNLVMSIRGGTLQEVLPLTCRYIILESGQPQFRQFIQSYCCRALPSLFPSDEARNFVGHLRRSQIGIKHLLEIAEFELAGIEAELGLNPGAVRFTCNPDLLLAALAAGELPRNLPQEEIELTVIRQSHVPQ